MPTARELYLTRAKTLPSVPGAKPEKIPTILFPMLATLTGQPFSGPEWLFEVKLDGVRALTYISGGKVRMLSRNQKEIGFRYPELANLSSVIDAKEAILDGEIVTLNEKGQPSFQLLQSRMGLTQDKEILRLAQQQPVIYYVFDILHYNGFNVRPAMLIHRKALLKEMLEENDNVRFSEHVLDDGETFYRQAKKARLEGIVAKLQSSAYVQKRTRDWLKIKTVERQEVVIGGYTSPRGSRVLFGSLIAGLYDAGELRYVGHVGGGFNQESLAKLYKMMQSLKVAKSPFRRIPKTNEKVQWIRPALVCEVKFSEWTADGKLRQPIFLGLRDDKDPMECVIESKA